MTSYQKSEAEKTELEKKNKKLHSQLEKLKNAPKQVKVDITKSQEI